MGTGSTPGHSFVALLAQALGEGTQVLNLGHGGDTSGELMEHGHLEQALAEIRARDSDDRPDNDVRLVTITIGGNDMLDLFFNYVARGRCADRAAFLSSQECLGLFRVTLDSLERNLDTVLSLLREALPQAAIVLFTLYNPFSGRDPNVGPLGDLALEGEAGTPVPEGVNDVLKAVAQRHAVLVADVFPPFEGHGAELVSADGIHPNDRGYQVMADVALAVLASAAR